MYEIGVVGGFEAALSMIGDFGPANRLHGHTYRVEVTLRAKDIQPDGTVYDIARLRDLLARAIGPLHYQYLNDLPYFKGINPTVEVVAKHIYNVMHPQLQGYLFSVRVWESQEAFAGYDGDSEH